jgi:hypothetical protein
MPKLTRMNMTEIIPMHTRTGAIITTTLKPALILERETLGSICPA